MDIVLYLHYNVYNILIFITYSFYYVHVILYIVFIFRCFFAVV